MHSETSSIEVNCRPISILLPWEQKAIERNVVLGSMGENGGRLRARILVVFRYSALIQRPNPR